MIFFCLKLLKLGFDPNKSAKKRLIIANLGLITFYAFMMVASLFLILRVISGDNLQPFIISYCVNNTYTTLFSMGFCLVLHAAYRRFDTINDCIKYNFKTEEEDVQKVFPKNSLSPQRLIIKLADLHDALNDCVVDMNRCYCLEVSL